MAGERVVAIEEQLDLGGLDVVEVDAAGRRVVPGLVDGHVHVIGGGGNEGYASRIPELWVGELVEAGITTVVAPPGLDMVAKNLEGLLAKTYALESEGISAYMMVGGFQRPFRTVTGSLMTDIFAIEKVIGVKVALGEVKSTAFPDQELTELAAQLHYLAGATGKACLLHAHLGQSTDPAAGFLHAMRTSGRAGARGSRQRTATTPATRWRRRSRSPPPVATSTSTRSSARTSATRTPYRPPRRSSRTLAAGVDPALVTMTTDGNASVPILLEDGTRDSYEKSLDWMWQTAVELVTAHGVPLRAGAVFRHQQPGTGAGAGPQGPTPRRWRRRPARHRR